MGNCPSVCRTWLIPAARDRRPAEAPSCSCANRIALSYGLSSLANGELWRLPVRVIWALPMSDQDPAGSRKVPKTNTLIVVSTCATALRLRRLRRSFEKSCLRPETLPKLLQYVLMRIVRIAKVGFR